MHHNTKISLLFKTFKGIAKAMADQFTRKPQAAVEWNLFSNLEEQTFQKSLKTA